MRRVLVPHLGLLVGLAGVVILAPAGLRADRTSHGDVRVVVSGFAHDRGKALVGIYRSARGFPDDGGVAARRVEARIRDRTAEVWFRDVPPGTFAIAVLHDEDGDFEMDTNILGMPTEGYGVSRDAVRPFGPPRFRDARLRLAPDELKLVRIRMHY